MKEVREAYQTAVNELKEATNRLRTEIQKIDMEQVGESAKDWVKENPGLALFLAIGAGMLVGRAVTKALEPPPPPRLSERARRHAYELAGTTRRMAGDTAERLSRHAHDVGEQVADRLHELRHTVHDRGEAFGERIARRAGDLGSLASEKTDHLVASFTNAAERAADSLQVAARDLSKSLKKRRKSPENFLDALTYAAKTVFGAYVFTRLSDWIRERR